MHLCANLSLLFAEVPMPERIGLAAASGFASVEIQFPEEYDLPALARASAAKGLPVTLINVPRGEADEVGLAALPGREPDFAAAMAACARQAELLGVAKVNVLAGRVPQSADRGACMRTLVDNLRRAGDLFGAIGVRVMVEAINPIDVPGFFLDRLDTAMEAIELVGHENVRLQFDLYHMSLTEPDLVDAIGKAGSAVGHVQFADAPGRHEPGTGGINFAAAFKALRKIGYAGAVAAEYRPAAETVAGLGWMPEFHRLMAADPSAQ